MPTVRPEVVDAGVGQPHLGRLELLGRHRDGDVLHAAEALGHRLEAQPGEVEEGEHVAVADVEEEVRRAGVVPVLEQLDAAGSPAARRRTDGRLRVGADQGQVVHAAPGRRRSVVGRQDVALAQLPAAIGEAGAFGGIGLGHDRQRYRGGRDRDVSPPARSAGRPPCLPSRARRGHSGREVHARHPGGRATWSVVGQPSPPW